MSIPSSKKLADREVFLLTCLVCAESGEGAVTVAPLHVRFLRSSGARFHTPFFDESVNVFFPFHVGRRSRVAAGEGTARIVGRAEEPPLDGSLVRSIYRSARRLQRPRRPPREWLPPRLTAHDKAAVGLGVAATAAASRDPSVPGPIPVEFRVVPRFEQLDAIRLIHRTDATAPPPACRGRRRGHACS